LRAAIRLAALVPSKLVTSLRTKAVTIVDNGSVIPYFTEYG